MKDGSYYLEYNNDIGSNQPCATSMQVEIYYLQKQMLKKFCDRVGSNPGTSHLRYSTLTMPQIGGIRV